MSNLPPGVTESMLPGNRPQDLEWERMLEKMGDAIDELRNYAKKLIADSRYYSHDPDEWEQLYADAIEVYSE